MSISKEAIEAARLAVERAMRQRTYDRHAHDDEVFQEGVAHIATAALTAAAPHIRAAALRDAAGEADYRAEASHKVSQNRAAHDFPTRVRYAAYAEEARCIAHVLRARADQLEGKTK